jgi:hypothetical protein
MKKYYLQTENEGSFDFEELKSKNNKNDSRLVCRNGRLENSWELEELKTFDYNPPAIKSFTKTDTILENTKKKHRRSKLLGLTKTSLAAGILIYLLDCSSLIITRKEKIT